jgi:cytochrome c peroxidase
MGLDAKKIALGKRLFHDANLSADGTISCASCHSLINDGVDSLPVSIGINGQKGSRNAPTIFNSSLLYRQFWDARVTTLEEQAAGPLTNPLEMGGNWKDILHYIRTNSLYKNAFNESYGRIATQKTVTHAIAEFERSLLTPNGPFDRYLKGDSGAIDMPTKRGYQLFKSLGCASCHQGAAVGGNFSEKLGVVIPYFKTNLTEQQDLGRYHLTNIEEERFEFKVPSLRNVTRTAPYLHDGSIETLEEVVKIMTKHQLGRVITEKEVTEIISFLHSLKGELNAN